MFKTPRVTEETDTRLRLHQPRSYLLAAAGGVFVACLIGLWAVLPHAVTLACDRASNRCVLTESTIVSAETETWKASAMREVSVERVRAGKGSHMELVVTGMDGGHRFNLYGAEADKADADAAALNDFIARPDVPTVTVRGVIDQTGLWVLEGLLLPFIMLFTVLALVTVDTTLDRGHDRIVVRRRLIGPGRESEASLDGARLVRMPSRYGNNLALHVDRPGKRRLVCLLLTSASSEACDEWAQRLAPYLPADAEALVR